MSQEPWNDEIYNTEEKSRKGRKESGGAAIKIFTILAVLFLIIVAAIITFAIYLSSGGSNTDSTQEFYNSNTTVASEAAKNTEKTAESTEAPAEGQPTTEATTTELSHAEPGATLTVEAGEGVGSIASRAGISIADLERLNPEKMTGPGGTWWANPGDTVRIK